ncbi:hypothetical protein CROQUDRAFT_131004 [Cronartium quercuum f. sp. fusiforme G11]|uniref:Uncharacterized protein n=1 Tax=Cronartium quercuum f. sp. fusiforme G11 TaxID=708437 RepID=A0A9P6TFD0_9BASI|nr:hypothetical protein CROQUDRAFT_131004 [Cronartium quercuum f. sp. fusiforme G11]
MTTATSKSMPASAPIDLNVIAPTTYVENDAPRSPPPTYVLAQAAYPAATTPPAEVDLERQDGPDAEKKDRLLRLKGGCCCCDCLYDLLRCLLCCCIFEVFIICRVALGVHTVMSQRSVFQMFVPNPASRRRIDQALRHTSLKKTLFLIP